MCKNEKLQGLVGSENYKNIYINTSTISLKSSFPFFQVAVAVLSCCAEGALKKKSLKGDER